jgi:hypothetical protein
MFENGRRGASQSSLSLARLSLWTRFVVVPISSFSVGFPLSLLQLVLMSVMVAASPQARGLRILRCLVLPSYLSLCVCSVQRRFLRSHTPRTHTTLTHTHGRPEAESELPPAPQDAKSVQRSLSISLSLSLSLSPVCVCVCVWCAVIDVIRKGRRIPCALKTLMLCSFARDHRVCLA